MNTDTTDTRKTEYVCILHRRRLRGTSVVVQRVIQDETHRASRSDSRRARMSLVRTGPLTLRMMERLVSSRNSTLTWVTPPREPVRPRTCKHRWSDQHLGLLTISVSMNLGHGGELNWDLCCSILYNSVRYEHNEQHGRGG